MRLSKHHHKFLVNIIPLKRKKIVDDADRQIIIKKHHLFFICIFLLVLIFVIFLSFIKISFNDVAIELTLDQLSFILTEKWNIYSIGVSSLVISHLSDLEIYPLKLEEGILDSTDISQVENWRVINVQRPLKISSTEDFWNISISSEYLNISSLYIDSGAVITISSYDCKNNKFLLSIDRCNLIGTIETGNTYELSCNYYKIENLLKENMPIYKTFRVLQQEREIHFQDLKKSIQIVIELSPKQSKIDPFILGKNININDINFTKWDGINRESTIIGNGLIYFPEYDDRNFEMKAGDFLIIENIKDFQIKRLILDNNIKASLYGKAKNVKSGTHQSYLYSRSPSILEHLYNYEVVNIKIIQILTTIITIFSALIKIVYRLRIVVDK